MSRLLEGESDVRQQEDDSDSDDEHAFEAETVGQDPKAQEERSVRAADPNSFAQAKAEYDRVRREKVQASLHRIYLDNSVARQSKKPKQFSMVSLPPSSSMIPPSQRPGGTVPQFRENGSKLESPQRVSKSKVQASAAAGAFERDPPSASASENDEQLASKAPDEELRQAARNGDLATLKALLEGGVDIDAASKRGYTAFIAACNAGQVEVAQFLVERGCDREKRTAHGTTGFFEACRKGHTPVVRYLVRTGCATNVPDKDGFEPIYIAYQEGHDDVVQLLVTSGCDTNGLSDQQLAIHKDKLRSFHQRVDEERDVLKRQLHNAMKEMSARAVELDSAKFANANGVDMMEAGLKSVEQRVKLLQSQIAQCSDSKNIASSSINELDSHPRLEEWFDMHDSRFEGKVFGKLGFKDGKITRTSRVTDTGRVGMANGIVQTRSGARYLLGTRFFGPVLESWSQDEAHFRGRLCGHPNPSVADGTEFQFERVPQHEKQDGLFITHSGVKVQLGAKAGQDAGWTVSLVSSPDAGEEGEEAPVVVPLHHGTQIVGRGARSGVWDAGCDVNQLEITVNRVQLTVEVRRLGQHPSFVWRGNKWVVLEKYMVYTLSNRERVSLLDCRFVFELRASLRSNSAPSLVVQESPREGFENEDDDDE